MKIKRRLQDLCLLAGLMALLTACGGGGDSSGTTNHQPTAEAGTNQAVLVNAEVSLDGSNSKGVDGDALTYSWRLISKPSNSTSSLTNPTTVKPKLVVDKIGDYVIGLIVKDGSLSSATDTVIIKVTSNPTTNRPPVAQAGADKTVNVAQVVSLDGSASSDADANPLTYQWSLTNKPSNSSAVLSSVNQAKTTITVDKAGQYMAALIVNDGTVNSAIDTVVINVLAAVNQAPLAQAGADKTVSLGQVISLDGSASSDANGDVLTYQWSLVSKPTNSIATLSNSTQAKASLTADKLGRYVASLVVNDGKVSSEIDSVTIDVASSSNHAPVAQAGSDKGASLGQTVSLDGSLSSDTDGDVLTYQWTLNSKPIDSTATISNANQAKASVAVDKSGQYVASLVVNDGKANSAADTITITVSAVNQAPTVNAGADIAAEVTDFPLGMFGVSLVAEGQDPNGDTLSYQWEIVTKPIASKLNSLDSDPPGYARLVPDALGKYEIKVTVSDGVLTASDNVIVTVTRQSNNPPVASAADKYVLVGKTISLDASASSDLDRDPLLYNWVVKSAPVGSTANLSSSTAVKPTLTPDKIGDYLFDLIVTDGIANSTAFAVKVSAQPVLNTLSYQVIDAEYSKALDKLIMVAHAPNQLHIYDATTKTEQAITLPLIPTSISVEPDGLYAAVGHDANVSYIDLKNAKLLKTLPVATKVLDVVLAGNGYAYAFPKEDQWENIYSINLTTGEVTSGSGYMIYAGTLAKLHPSGTSMYGANNGLSPSDIEKYDIQSGTAKKLYDAPYHGNYAMCGNLWFSEDGKRIFTACGNVFRASDIQAQDMIYNGSLSELPNVKDLVHSATAAKVVAIQAPGFTSMANDEDTKLLTYDYEFLTPSETLDLPYFMINDKGYLGHGRFVFFNKAADTIVVILQADASSGMLNDTAIFTIKR